MFLFFQGKKKLERLFNYSFKNKDLLQQALTRKTIFQQPSLVPDEVFTVGHNEQLEFLGDSVLRMVIDAFLLSLYPDWNEEKLSNKRDELVSKDGFLWQAGETWQLDQYIILGKNELSNLQNAGRKRILNCVMEAIIGAVFIDSERNYQIIEAFIANIPSFPYAAIIKGKRLYEAVSNDNLPSVKLWLKYGANPNYTQKDNFHISCPCGVMIRGDKLAMIWFEVKSYIHNFCTPLDLVIRRIGFKKHVLEIIKVLLEYGADPNYLGDFEVPLLHQTIIYYGKDTKTPYLHEICSLLCQYGANVHLRASALYCSCREKDSKSTPMELALLRGDENVIRVLSTYGASHTQAVDWYDRKLTEKRSSSKIDCST